MSKKILIIGSGGREHALGWKIKQSNQVEKIFFAPGNGGTKDIGENIPIGVEDIDSLLNFAKEKKIDLTIVGPEAPLAKGIVDTFESAGLKIFGPSRQATQLETSKAWALEFMRKYGIPHPEFHIFTDPKKANKFIQTTSWNGYVIKADGLALGKGVVVASSKEEALQAIDQMKEFGDAGKTIIIQEKLDGYEVSITAFADGNTAIPLLSVQDHKRIYNNDRGPNTGGMGAYAPVPFLTADLLQKIEKTILQPVIKGMKEEGVPYKGIIYPGLMMTQDGPKVLEFNVRFGDPETQPLMMLLNSDIISIMEACIEENLSDEKITFRDGTAICVVLAAEGYPGSYKKGEIIHGLDSLGDKNMQVFQAGTAVKENELVTAGGRVLGVTTYGKSIQEARKKIYEVIGKTGVYFTGMQYRKDIGAKALT